MQRSDLCESHAEELANTISHGIGAVLSAIGLAIMIYLAAPLSAWHVVSVSVFGGSLVLLYAASAMYHYVTSHGKKRVLQIVDHALIFVLIAGSYTPWLLVNLRGAWGWSLFGVVWGIALTGIVLKAFFLPRFDRVGTVLYVVMGWLICIAFRPMMQVISTEALAWLIAGGLCYTGGVFFYLRRNMKYSHLTWHLFVMAGSLCHVIAVITGVLVEHS